jgi:hypothetical protein
LINETTAQVEPGASTLTVELEVLLTAQVEQLVLVVELWAGELLAFSGEQVITVDASQPVTTVSTVNLVPIAPALTVSPLALDYSVSAGGIPAELLFTVGNVGGAPLGWTATTDVMGLSLDPGSGMLNPGQSSTVLAMHDPGQLNPGSYGGSITVAASAALSSPQVIAVTVEVTEPPFIELSASSLDFVAQEGADAEPQSVILTNTGGGILNWTAVPEASWVGVEPSSGTLGAQETTQLTITLSAQGLVPGTHSGIILIQDPNASNSPRILSVNVVVTEGPRIGLSATSLDIAAWLNEDAPVQRLTLSNDGGGTLDWTASDDAPWLGVSPTSGSLSEGASSTLSLTPSTAGLALGSHSATVTLEAPGASNSPRSVGVNVTVAERPRIGLSPTSMTFVAECTAPPQTLVIRNTGGSELEWVAESSAGWLKATPASGTLGTGQSQPVSVSAESSTTDYYLTATLSVSDPDASNSPRTVFVELESQCIGAPAGE